MKKIDAFLRPENIEDIKAKLDEMDINGLSISQVMGCGRQRGWKEYVRGTQIDYNFLPKIKLEIVVTDEKVEAVISKICDVAYTGEVGDGKIFVFDVADAVRIRTCERGDIAVK